jgi:hypothetical protein
MGVELNGREFGRSVIEPSTDRVRDTVSPLVAADRPNGKEISIILDKSTAHAMAHLLVRPIDAELFERILQRVKVSSTIGMAIIGGDKYLFEMLKTVLSCNKRAISHAEVYKSSNRTHDIQHSDELDGPIGSSTSRQAFIDDGDEPLWGPDR